MIYVHVLNKLQGWLPSKQIAQTLRAVASDRYLVSLMLWQMHCWSRRMYNMDGDNVRGSISLSTKSCAALEISWTLSPAQPTIE